jgi:hypothetical protein
MFCLPYNLEDASGLPPQKSGWEFQEVVENNWTYEKVAGIHYVDLHKESPTD